MEASRAWFLKLLDGLKEEQWDAKPYPNVMSIRETLAHMVTNDRVLPVMLKGEEPDYESFRPDAGLSHDDLLALLAETHKAKIDFLSQTYMDRDLNEEMQTVYSGKKPIWSEILGFVPEDWYHIGQMSLVRQGTDANWDYYAHFYSG
ncbi:MAG: DinB family protein [Armatimonadetes bacterium]|nr:DinB family protein [Armatimonadota bacterium]